MPQNSSRLATERGELVTHGALRTVMILSSELTVLSVCTLPARRSQCSVHLGVTVSSAVPAAGLWLQLFCSSSIAASMLFRRFATAAVVAALGIASQHLLVLHKVKHQCAEEHTDAGQHHGEGCEGQNDGIIHGIHGVLVLLRLMIC